MYDIVLVVAEDDPSSVFVVVFVLVSPSTEASLVTIALAATSGQSSTYVVFVLSPSPSPSALAETPLTVVLLVGNCSDTPPSALETTRIVTVTTLSSSPFVDVLVLVVAMEEVEEEEEAKEVNAVAGGVAVELA